MFDNPNQELKRLEDELLKAEMTDEEFERFYDDIYEEFGPVAEQEEDLLAGSPVKPVRNYANGYGAQTRPVQQRPQQSANVQRPQQMNGGQRPQHSANGQRPVGQNRAPQTNRYMPPQGKDRGIKGLVITACIECAGIVGVVLWWMIRIL